MTRVAKRRPTRSSRSLLGLIAADPWRKLLALLIAVLLWYWLDRQVTSRKEVQLTPVAVDASDPKRDSRRTNEGELQVRLPTSQFVITEFRDASSGKALEQRVRLDLVGAQYTIDSVEANVAFAVKLDLKAAPEGETFTEQFDVRDLRPLDRDLRRLMDKATMTPPSIEVVIEHVVSEPITLSYKDVTVQNPDPTRYPNFNARLVLDDVRFEPTSVQVYGPAGAMDRLRKRNKVFLLDLAEGRVEADVASGPLRLIDFPGSSSVRIAGDIVPEATFRLRPRFEEFSLQVPVLLDPAAMPAALRSRYRATTERAEVNLQASGSLETLLADKSPAELAEWAMRQTRLLATFDEGADRDRIVVEPLFVLLDRTWREGLDFRVVSPPPITLERQTTGPNEDIDPNK